MFELALTGQKAAGPSKMTYAQFLTWLQNKNITTVTKTTNVNVMSGKYTQAALDTTGQLLMYGSSYGTHMTNDSLIHAVMLHACPTQTIADELRANSRICLFLITTAQTYATFNAVTRNGYTSRSYSNYTGCNLVDFVYYDASQGYMMQYNPSTLSTPAFFTGALKSL